MCHLDTLILALRLYGSNTIKQEGSRTRPNGTASTVEKLLTCFWKAVQPWCSSRQSSSSKNHWLELYQKIWALSGSIFWTYLSSICNSKGTFCAAFECCFLTCCFLKSKWMFYLFVVPVFILSGFHSHIFPLLPVGTTEYCNWPHSRVAVRAVAHQPPTGPAAHWLALHALGSPGSSPRWVSTMNAQSNG